jgi:hypothetical protein
MLLSVPEIPKILHFSSYSKIKLFSSVQRSSNSLPRFLQMNFNPEMWLYLRLLTCFLYPEFNYYLGITKIIPKNIYDNFITEKKIKLSNNREHDETDR